MSEPDGGTPVADDHEHIHEDHEHGQGHEHGQDHAHARAHGVASEPVRGSFVPQRAAGLVGLELDGELLLLDPRTDRLHVLDALGTVIWNVFDGNVTVDELTGDLADVFGAPAETVRTDLGGLVDALRAADLLVGTQPPTQHLVATDPADPADPADPRPSGTTDPDGLWRPNYLVNPPAP